MASTSDMGAFVNLLTWIERVKVEKMWPELHTAIKCLKVKVTGEQLGRLEYPLKHVRAAARVA